MDDLVFKTKVISELSEVKTNLKEHMRRTEILESAMKPLQAHVAMWAGAFKLVVVLAAIAGLAKVLIDLVAR